MVRGKPRPNRRVYTDEEMKNFFACIERINERSIKMHIDTQDIKVNDLLKFDGDRLWYKVQARDDKFIVCNKEIKGGECYHTILDLEKNIRGDDNLVFHSGYDTQELCQERLKEFATGEIEISYRNRVDLVIKDHKKV